MGGDWGSFGCLASRDWPLLSNFQSKCKDRAPPPLFFLHISPFSELNSANVTKCKSVYMAHLSTGFGLAMASVILGGCSIDNIITNLEAESDTGDQSEEETYLFMFQGFSRITASLLVGRWQGYALKFSSKDAVCFFVNPFIWHLWQVVFSFETMIFFFLNKQIFARSFW